MQGNLVVGHLVQLEFFRVEVFVIRSDTGEDSLQYGIGPDVGITVPGRCLPLRSRLLARPEYRGHISGSKGLVYAVDGLHVVGAGGQADLAVQLVVVHDVLLAGDLAVAHFYQRYALKVYVVAAGRDTEELPGVLTLETPVFNDFVALAKGVHYGKFDVGKAGQEVTIAMPSVTSYNHTPSYCRRAGSRGSTRSVSA